MLFCFFFCACVLSLYIFSIFLRVTNFALYRSFRLSLYLSKITPKAVSVLAYNKISVPKVARSTLVVQDMRHFELRARTSLYWWIIVERLVYVH